MKTSNVPRFNWKQSTALLVLLGCCSRTSGGVAESEKVVELGPHHAVVEIVAHGVGPNGESTSITNSYVRLETGMNFMGDSGTWESSEATFQLVPGAAIAWKGQHKVSLAANANTADAVVQRLPNNQLLTGHVRGLAYHDLATGETVLFPELQDSQGLLIAENQVLYPGAFGELADLRYTTTKSSFEQDVILRRQPPSASKFGLNPATTRLEVWTEFTGSPDPKIRQTDAAGTALNAKATIQTEEPQDENLDFGSMRMGPGKTFRLAAEEENLTLVVKNWVIAEDGRRFLVEAVPPQAFSEALEQLPAEADAGDAGLRKPYRNRLQALKSLPVTPDRRATQTALMRRLERGRDDIVLAQVARPGVVVDYATVNTSQNNYTFASDETYYISGAVILTGLTTFEGGTVVKMDTSTSAKLEVQGPLTIDGGAYKPVIITAKDDNTVGETIVGSVPANLGTTFYGSSGGTLVLNNGASVLLKYLRVNHQRRAITYTAGASLTHTLSHAQFVRCLEGLAPANTVNIYNALFNNVTKVLTGTAATVNCQHITANVGTYFNYNNAATLSFINSLVVGVTTLGTTQAGYAPDTASSGAGIFQAVSAGNHYLVAGSPYRNVGSLAIDPTLANELKTMSTSAPEVLTGPVNLDTTLRPRVPRDTDAPDKGFHYAVLDYILKQVTLTVPLRLTNGVAVAVAGTYGVDLQSGSSLIGEGRAENLNRLTRWHNVQEQSAAEGNGGPMLKVTSAYSVRPVFSLRFTEITCPSKSGTTLLDQSSTMPLQSITLEFCQLRNVGVPSVWPIDTLNEAVTFNNNLFERSKLSVNKSNYSQNTPITLVARNNLFWRGNISINYDSGTINPAWTIKDNLFDGIGQTLTGSLITQVVRSNNGFTSGTPTTYSVSGDKIGLSTDYQANGTWGKRYYPASGSTPSLSTLIDAGSQSREAAGLYHFTVKTATSTKEGADVSPNVDIGFHYVGLNSSNVPNDYDGDGIPDYVEDRNGNNVVDGPETNWQQSNGVGPGANALLLFTVFQP